MNYDLESLAWKIDNEGIGYAVTGYFSVREIQEHPDIPQEIKDAWVRAAKDLTLIEDFFSEYLL